MKPPSSLKNQTNFFLEKSYVDMKLHVKSMGQGPALIILHGLFGSSDNWMSLAKTFSQYFSVYLVDQRNHGRSPHSEAWDYPHMAEDIMTFMEDHGIFRASILGHSMGGKTALQFAVDYPDYLEKLIVVDMGIKGYAPHHEAILTALNSIVLDQVANRREVDQQLAQGIPDAGTRMFLMKGLTRDGDKQFVWRFNLKVIAKLYAHILAPITFDIPYGGPTLMLYGGKSTYVLPEDHPAILASLPMTTFEMIPQAGHWVHADAPEALIQSVLAFMGERS